MALHWGVGDVKDWETVTRIEADGETRMNPITERLIWATMPIGMSAITEANADEFFVRLWIFDHVMGPMMWGPSPENKPIYVSREQVRQHIGLWTNASKLTRTVFYRELEERVRREMVR